MKFVILYYVEVFNLLQLSSLRLVFTNSQLSIKKPKNVSTFIERACSFQYSTNTYQTKFKIHLQNYRSSIEDTFC